MVPMRLDALYIPASKQDIQGLLTLPAMADYSQLPYYNQHGVVKDRTPNLSATILASAFEQVYPLRAGVHLHWALPDTLTRGESGEAGTTFPLVPNRWLVTRKRGQTVEKHWVVESDYIYPEGANPPHTVTVLYPPEPGSFQPFRYLGRTQDISGGYRTGSSDDYLPTLTAMGPFSLVPKADEVKATFAAFYPNCSSVFGFYDSNYKSDAAPQGVTYEVVGWYSKASTDALGTAIAQFQQDYQQQHQGSSPTEDQIANFLAQDWEWQVPTNARPVPRQTLCYARLTFTTSDVRDPVANIGIPDIAVGNTGTEALSAYLAQEIDLSNKSTLEEQLEALQLAESLEQKQLDISAQFQDARHEKGFTPFSGGTIWTIESAKPTDNQNGGNGSQVTLPDNLATQLNELNQQQQAYQQTLDEIESMCQQVFADCWKNIKENHGSLGNCQNTYFFNSNFDADEIRGFIESRDLPPTYKKIIDTGELELQLSNGGSCSGSAEISNV